MNYTWIAGHLGSDPETRFTPGGKKVTSLRVACKSRKGGKDETMWWRVTVWGETFDKIMPFFKKGSPIIVCGEMMPPELFQNKEGTTVVSLTITASHISFSPFGKPKANEEGGYKAPSEGSSDYGFSQNQSPPSFNSIGADYEVSDEEIPF